MRNVTVDKWRSHNTEQRFIEFSTKSADIELDKMVNPEHWKHLKETISHCLKVLSSPTKKVVFCLFTEADYKVFEEQLQKELSNESDASQ